MFGDSPRNHVRDSPDRGVRRKDDCIVSEIYVVFDRRTRKESWMRDKQLK